MVIISSSYKLIFYEKSICFVGCCCKSLFSLWFWWVLVVFGRYLRFLVPFGWICLIYMIFVIFGWNLRFLNICWNFKRKICFSRLFTSICEICDFFLLVIETCAFHHFYINSCNLCDFSWFLVDICDFITQTHTVSAISSVCCSYVTISSKPLNLGRYYFRVGVIYGYRRFSKDLDVRRMAVNLNYNSQQLHY